jgi:transcriptional regulator with XRE-family HTH domain
MITSVGKYLRKLRIDKGEVMRNMAQKIGVSSAFLSAVETGKKKMPADWPTKIANLYQLDESQKFELYKVVAETNKVVELDLGRANDMEKTVAVAFARRFPDFTEKELLDIKGILDRKKV